MPIIVNRSGSPGSGPNAGKGKGRGFTKLIDRFCAKYNFDERAEDYISQVEAPVALEVILFGGNFGTCENPSSLLTHQLNMEGCGKGMGKGVSPELVGAISKVCEGNLNELNRVVEQAPDLGVFFSAEAEERLALAEERHHDDVKELALACAAAKWCNVDRRWIDWVDTKQRCLAGLKAAEGEEDWRAMVGAISLARSKGLYKARANWLLAQVRDKVSAEVAKACGRPDLEGGTQVLRDLEATDLRDALADCLRYARERLSRAEQQAQTRSVGFAGGKGKGEGKDRGEARSQSRLTVRFDAAVRSSSEVSRGKGEDKGRDKGKGKGTGRESRSVSPAPSSSGTPGRSSGLSSCSNMSNSRWEDVMLDPLEVCFTHNNISSRFRTDNERGIPLTGGGAKLDDVIEQIMDGRLDPNDLPRLELVEYKGKIYSLSNRRLFIFRVLRVKGCVRTLRGKKFPFESRRLQQMREDRWTGEMASKWDRSYSTINEGRWVDVFSKYKEFQNP